MSSHRDAVVLPAQEGCVSRVQDPQLLSQIVEVSGDAIFSEALDGTITSWNAAAERLYGRTAHEMLGRSMTDLLPDATALELRTAHDAALSGQSVKRFDSWHLRADGRRIAVSLTVSPLHDSDGAVAGLATSVQDVTDRVELAAEVEAARSVQAKQNAALERSNRDLEQFAFVASHDLSEPLRAMTGFVTLLEKRYVDELDERGRGYIAHVVEGAARMRALIEDLLEYSRYLTVNAPDRAVNTAVGARRVVTSMGASDAVDIGDLPDVWWDESAVLAVLGNLIGNGLKFHRPEVPPHVEVSGRLEDGRVLLCVDDNGIGIEPEYRDRVFRMFARLHVRDAYPGTGIGLAIVQQVAERSGGAVWTEGSHLGGSRFCITLPAVPRTEPPA